MIVISGDTHGDYDSYKIDKLLENIDDGLLEVDFLIICGDFGFVWETTDNNTISERDMENIELYFKDAPFVTLFCPGNHENYDILDSLPRVDKYGGSCAEVLKDKVYMVDRGEILTLHEKKFLFLGGAYSVDKGYRRAHISWWPQETITKKDYENSVSNLKKVNNKVDYVITHTCPKSLGSMVLLSVLGPAAFKRESLYGGKVKDASCTYLQKLLDNGLQFTDWYFGHFHVDEDYLEKYHCLYRNLLHIDPEKNSDKDA